ncbi:MAG: hypothetical protein ACRDLS_10975 [Solirubrobacteraceae bacterium]
MSLDGGVEILKLARLLGAEPEDLGYLQYVAPQDIRDVREQVTAAIFDADRQMLQRVAAATKVIPSKLAAAVAQQALGALLCARVTSLLEPARAVDIARRLPTDFLADLAVELDPRRASRVIAEIPARQIGQITAELVEREEYIAMGGFVGHLPEASLRAATEAVDDEALLLTASVIEAKGNLGALVGLLDEERLESIIRTAHEADLWPEALDVLGHVSERQRGQLGDLAAAQEDAVLDGMVRAAQSERLWADVLPVTRAMSPDSRARFAKLKSVQTRPVLASIVDAASQQHLWPELLVLLPLLPAAARRRVAALGTGFGRSIFEQIVRAADEHDLWDALELFASELEPGSQQQIEELYKAVGRA